LNLPAASRIYFLNPCFRPHIEAQAIKRAHRIGQTHAVHVETLVLKGTVEEKMLERSKRMTRAEHLDANHLEDDGGIKQIIQEAVPLPIQEVEQSAYGQMAPLETPQQMWCRDGWQQFLQDQERPRSKKRKASDAAIKKQEKGADERPRKAVRRALAYVDCSGGASPDDRELPVHPTALSDENETRHNDDEGRPPGDTLTTASAAGMPEDLSRVANVGEMLDLRGSTAAPMQCSQEANMRNLSISELLNSERTPADMSDYDRNDLLQEILRRL